MTQSIAFVLTLEIRIRLHQILRHIYMSFSNKQSFILWYGPIAYFYKCRKPNTNGLAENFFPSNSYKEDKARTAKSIEESFGFFILPERIRYYFWASSFSLLFALWPHKVMLFDPYIFFGLANWGVILFLLMNFVGPLFVFGLCRAPVLRNLAAELPAGFEDWLEAGVLSFGRSSCQKWPFLLIVAWMIWPFGRHRESVAFRGAQCRQAALTRLALRELLMDRSQYHSRYSPLIRWIFYCLSPIWWHLLLIVMYLIFAARGGEDLVIPVVTWLFISLLMTSIEIKMMSNDFRVWPNSLKQFPIQVRIPRNEISHLIDERSFIIVINTITAVIAILLVTTATLVD